MHQKNRMCLGRALAQTRLLDYQQVLMQYIPQLYTYNSNTIRIYMTIYIHIKRTWVKKRNILNITFPLTTCTLINQRITCTNNSLVGWEIRIHQKIKHSTKYGHHDYWHVIYINHIIYQSPQRYGQKHRNSNPPPHTLLWGAIFGEIFLVINFSQIQYSTYNTKIFIHYLYSKITLHLIFATLSKNFNYLHKCEGNSFLNKIRCN
eukprot:TRINITY_DN455_c1_g1_i1.p1 TRINITY_DN455_c1_g1~~TRINITY_DN455_c1_g1_i1.p1  ORF type:complete len:205 (+),score=-21.11 TRINITY_DN455_c1_g1_i1:124-738(+)